MDAFEVGPAVGVNDQVAEAGSPCEPVGEVGRNDLDVGQSAKGVGVGGGLADPMRTQAETARSITTWTACQRCKRTASAAAVSGRSSEGSGGR